MSTLLCQKRTGYLTQLYVRDKRFLIARFAESLVLLRKGTDTGDPYSWTIDTVDTEDTGLYSCVAGNILGETVHIAHLEVSPAPRPRPAHLAWALLGAVLAAR